MDLAGALEAAGHPQSPTPGAAVPGDKRPSSRRSCPLALPLGFDHPQGRPGTRGQAWKIQFFGTCYFSFPRRPDRKSAQRTSGQHSDRPGKVWMTAKRITSKDGADMSLRTRVSGTSSSRSGVRTSGRSCAAKALLPKMVPPIARSNGLARSSCFLKRIKKRSVVEIVQKSWGVIDAVRHDVVASAGKLHADRSKYRIPPPISKRRGPHLSEKNEPRQSAVRPAGEKLNFPGLTPYLRRSVKAGSG
jgi:hypothetical protein